MTEARELPRMTSPIWRCRDRAFDAGNGPPLVMGILNVTPDSFSDGGRYLDPGAAVAHGLAMLRDGADILDVGGESTRPGAAPVPADAEAARVCPVIERLFGETGAVISVDTMKASVASKAIAAGARIVNDVSALTHDPDMTDVVRETGAGVILMHMKGEPRTMQIAPEYRDVTGEVCEYLRQRMEDVSARGIQPERIALDPGIGFGKTVQHNLVLLANLDRLAIMGRPVAVGLSRKSFLGKLTGRDPGERMAASIAGLVYSVLAGARIVRVHDVRESVDAIRVVDALRAEKA